MARSDGALDPHQKEIAKLMRANAHRHRPHRVFADFCEMAAISLSNAADRLHQAKREARYLEIVKQYEPNEVARFPQMLAHLVESLEAGFHDSLGALFMSFEFGDHWKGQFFTPYPVASLIARMVAGDFAARVKLEGFITVNEPACGAGAMVIAMAETARDQGVNYQQAMHVVATDIDATAVHMAYIQLALLHIPAIVVHGNSLALSAWDHWATPAHVLGLWDRRLQRAKDRQTTAPDEAQRVTHAKVEPDGDASEPSLRDEVVAQRLEKSGQMALF
jgi:hypothetical protein